MTDIIYDLIDTNLPKILYDLEGVSLNVEVKINENNDNNVDDEDAPSSTMMRLHAYFTGTSSFSLRGAPTSNELTQLLVKYFDVDDFNRQLKVPSKAARAAKSRAESISIKVNSVFFALVSIFHGSSKK